MTRPIHQSARGGVTLIEVLVVIGLIGILLGLLFPAVQQVRAAALRSKCQNNMRQIGLALHHYHAVHGHIPPGKEFHFLSNEPDSILSWQALILPEMEQGALWAASVQACAQTNLPYRNPPHVGYATVIPKATMSYGSTGPCVVLLQQDLNFVIKAGLKVDGKFGSNTQGAVETFQGKKPGCTGGVDGIAGKYTMSCLVAGSG